MIVITAIAIGATVILLLLVYQAFASDCEQRHGARLVTRSTFLLTGLLGWLVAGGYEWQQNLIASGGDVLNGSATIGLGVTLGATVVVRHFVKLGPFYGSLATTVHALLIIPSMILGPVYAAVLVLAAWGVQHVRIVK
jgi:hypothetical protein